MRGACHAQCLHVHATFQSFFLPARHKRRVRCLREQIADVPRELPRWRQAARLLRATWFPEQSATVRFDERQTCCKAPFEAVIVRCRNDISTACVGARTAIRKPQQIVPVAIEIMLHDQAR